MGPPVAALVLATVLIAPPGATGKKAPPTLCPGGRFLLGSALGDPATGVEAIVISGGFVTLTAACPAARAKLTAKRTGMRVTAVWPLCNVLGGKVHLSATVAPGCQTLTGTVVAPRAKLRTRIAGRRSECGDGVVDTGGGEQCETDTGCAPPGRCVACACISEVTTTTSSTTTTTTLTPVSFSADVQPIFAGNCALPFCHTGPVPQQHLDLSPRRAYASLVGVPSVECPGTARVQPSAPEQSYVIAKLAGEGVCFVGSRMPLGGVLPAADIETIRRWISEGALDN